MTAMLSVELTFETPFSFVLVELPSAFEKFWLMIELMIVTLFPLALPVPFA